MLRHGGSADSIKSTRNSSTRQLRSAVAEPQEIESQDTGPSYVSAVEILTVAVLFATSCVFVRPQLEGWGHLANFHAAWEQHVFQPFSLGSARLLENVPLGLAWLLGRGAVWAVALVYAVELVAKYLAARWAVSPLFSGSNRWAVASIAAIMFPWMREWRAHNMAQQLATIFLILALGAILRLTDSGWKTWTLRAGFAVLISLMFYEGLIACAAAIPLVILFGGRGNSGRSVSIIGRSIVAIAAGLLVYGAYSFLVLSNNNQEYHRLLVSSPHSPLRDPVRLISYLYSTTYFSYPWTIAALAGCMSALVGPRVLLLDRKQERIRTILALAAAVLVLPLLSLPFAVNFYFLSDVERVGLPCGFGFLLLCVTVLARYRSPDRDDGNFAASAVVVTVLLIGATADASTCYQPYRLQRVILDQAEALLRANKVAAVLVRDWTGMLGDTYTFAVPDTLQEALLVEGSGVQEVGLCTPGPVNRASPHLWSVGGASSLPRCDDLPRSGQAQLILDVRPQPDRMIPMVSSAGIIPGDPTVSSQFRTTLIEGSVGGKERMESKDFWWINKSEAVVELANDTGKNANLTWSATFLAPPCPGPPANTVRAIVSQQSATIAVNQPRIPFSLPVSVPAHGKELIRLEISGKNCQPELVNSRKFYLGIWGLSAKE